jgi:hypothetical protein
VPECASGTKGKSWQTEIRKQRMLRVFSSHFVKLSTVNALHLYNRVKSRTNYAIRIRWRIEFRKTALNTVNQLYSNSWCKNKSPATNKIIFANFTVNFLTGKLYLVPLPW